MGFKKAMKIAALSLLGLSSATAQQLPEHCRMPCDYNNDGVYNVVSVAAEKRADWNEDLQQTVEQLEDVVHELEHSGEDVSLTQKRISPPAVHTESSAAGDAF